MAAGRRIPEATVSRLPVYLRVLGDAAGERSTTISSELLAMRAGVNAAQVRKDLSYLGSYGTRGVGYNVAYLSHEINRQLGLGSHRKVAIVGIGNLGQALAGYGGFSARGFRMVAAFDADQGKVGSRLGDLTVRPMSEVASLVRDAGITMAVITTPAHAAQGATDALVAAGVTSVLNFAPTTLTVPAGVALRQVDLGVELQILSFYEQQATDGGGRRLDFGARPQTEQAAPQTVPVAAQTEQAAPLTVPVAAQTEQAAPLTVPVAAQTEQAAPQTAQAAEPGQPERPKAGADAGR